MSPSRYPLPGPRYLRPVTGGTGTAARPAAAHLVLAYSRPLEVTQMQDGRFPVEMVDGVPVVAAPEEIDITNAPELRSALLEAAAHGHGTLVADLSRTQFCDSSGLHTLLAAHKRATDAGDEMLLVIPGNAVLRVFTITGVDRIIP